MTPDHPAESFRARLKAGRPLLLDGATGTELDRRGVDTSLPLWSARALLAAPDVVKQIHLDYLDAGADVITTNTFRTHRRTLARAGYGGRAGELTRLAVSLARAAVAQSKRAAWVAGSMSPLEDCYSPALVPPDDELRAEHGEMARALAAAGCDVLLVETMNSIREAVIAAEAAQATGRPVCVSLVVGVDGRPPDQVTAGQAAGTAPMRLLSGEAIATAAAALHDRPPDVILVNCVPLAHIDRAFDELRAAAAGPIGLYANVGHADEVTGWALTDDVQPAAYARCARHWLAQGAAIVGGCCGTSPDHIAAVRAVMDEAQQSTTNNERTLIHRREDT